MHTKRSLYERLSVSAMDLGMAKQYAVHLLKKGWHSAPYERRGSIYMQQSAFTTSLVISYSRPFTESRGWPNFPKEFRQYDAWQAKFHGELIELRHQVFAHSDSKRYSIKPHRINAELITDIQGVPYLKLSKNECEQIVLMVNGIHQRLQPRLKELQSELADGKDA